MVTTQNVENKDKKVKTVDVKTLVKTNKLNPRTLPSINEQIKLDNDQGALLG